MFKRVLLLGVVAGIMAGAASIVYQSVYKASLGADFSKIVKPAGIVISSIIGCIIASLGYWLMHKLLKGKTDIVFNLLFAVLSIASIMPAFGVKLPLDVEMPELLPGMVIPMHFFPIMAWLTLRPLFMKQAADYVTVKSND